jgi:hypothetical protein
MAVILPARRCYPAYRFFNRREPAMNKTVFLALAASLAATPFALAQNPFDAMKGKVKPGLYNYKMEMDMGQVPGAPAGMGKQTMNMQHCLTPQDLEKGELTAKKEMPKDCKISDFKMSGSTASYRVACTGEFKMASDNVITFVGDGYRMAMKMQMDQGGQKMNMAQNIEAKYAGPCK